MTIVAKIINENCDDRIVHLEQGSHVFGSDLSCDVVLMDPSIKEKHFILHISDYKAEVEILCNDTCDFTRAHGGKEILTCNQRVQWHNDDCLHLDGIYVVLEGLQVDNEVIPQPHLDPNLQNSQQPQSNGIESKFSFPRSRIMTLASIVLTVVLGVFIVASGPLQVSFAAIDSTHELNTNISNDVMNRNATQNMAGKETELEQKLTELGVSEYYIEKQNGKWHVVVYMDGSKVRTDLKDQLAKLGLPITYHVYENKKLLNAVTRVLRNFSEKFTISELNKGALTIDMLGHTSLVTHKLKRTILADIPGIRKVSFLNASPEDIVGFSKEIKGLWAGKGAYVLLDDGRKIRPNQSIRSDVTLISVHYDKIVVRHQGQQKEVLVR